MKKSRFHSAIRRAAENNTNDLNTHIIYAGPSNLDWIDWEPDILQKIVEFDFESSTMTFFICTEIYS